MPRRGSQPRRHEDRSSSRLLKVLFLVALAFIVTGVRAESGPEAVVSGLMSAWNAKDAHAFASQFTDDATFVNVNGTLWTGDKEIEQRLANNVAFKSTQAEIKPESLRLVRPDIALMHVKLDDHGRLSFSATSLLFDDDGCR